MECLTTFVLLVLLPLSISALVLARRALGRQRAADQRTDFLETRLEALRRRVNGETSTPPPRAAAGIVGAGAASPAAKAPLQPTATAEEALAPTPAEPPSAAPLPPAVEPPAGPLTATPPLRKPRISLEERLAGRLPVWIGAIALVLAGAFLVKYSVDQGLLSPAVRVTLGVLFGAALLGGGEALRRSSPGVAQGLSAAGIADLFVAFYAAVGLYQLLSPGVGFALMGLTTAVAVALSLRQGPMVALLGLVGGFLTPQFVAPSTFEPRLLFGYLLLLQAGLLAVTRKRGWWPLAGLNLLATLAWTAHWLSGPFHHGDATVLGLFVLLSVCVVVAAALHRGGLAWGRPVIGTSLAWAAIGGGLLLTGWLTHAADFGSREWFFLAILAAGCLVLARLRDGMHGLAWLAAAVLAALEVLWIEPLTTSEATRFFLTTALLGALFTVGSYVALWGARRPDRWAALTATSALAFTLLAVAAGEQLQLDRPFGLVAVLVGALLIGFAMPVLQRREGLPHGEAALGALAAGATTMLALALPLELERQWLTAGWAAEVVALFWLAERLRVRILAHLGAVVAALVGVRLLLNPEVLHYPTGSHPLFSWLLYGYGVPIVALACAAALARRQGMPRLAGGLSWESVALALAFLFLGVRQYFHPGDLDAYKQYLAEWGALSLAWGLCGLLLVAWRRHPLVPSLAGSLALALTLAQALLTQGLVSNPLWSSESVGARPILNVLGWAYALPALLFLVAAWRQWGAAPLGDERRSGSDGQAAPQTAWAKRSLVRRLLPPWPGLWGGGSLLLAFVWLTLEVRHTFRGAHLNQGVTSHAEGWAYSAAWVVFAVLLMITGIRLRSRPVRLASLIIILVAVLKVFFYDTAHLAGLYRVFALLGVGAALLLLAYLFQRFVPGDDR